MKRIITIFLFLLVTTVIYGCTKFKLIIEGPDIIYIDNPVTLTHNFKGEGNITWSTSNEYIAQIDDDGTVNGQSSGNVEICLQINDYIAYKSITIKNDNYDITIDGSNCIEIGEKSKFEVIFPAGLNEEVEWSSYDENIATVTQSGIVKGINIGTTTIKAKINGSVALFDVTIINKKVEKIIISGRNKIPCGQSTILTISCYPENDKEKYTLASSDDSVATVSEDGLVKGLKIGKVEITATLISNPETKTSFLIEVTPSAPTSIKIEGNTMITQGQNTTLKVNFKGENVSEDVIWESLSPLIAIVSKGIVFGITEGKATIVAKSTIDNSIQDKITIDVKKYIAPDPNEDDVNYVNKIINNMTLSQKIGQMFVVGFNGTNFISSFANIIEQYNFGNVIYMGGNVSDYYSITQMSNDIQTKMIETNSVPGFIAIDQEGGKVARIKSGGTHFISNMAMAATNNYNNTYLEGLAVGKELYNYGINLDFAPVLDVNNNPNNPVIGVRSYSDNPIDVSLYGNNMINGLRDSNVMGCSKHFPGHGNTNVDSHYGLPIISSKIEDLYTTEIVPFMGAITNGIDCIMSAHIIFNEIDPNNPATLSKDVLTGLLREKLGYNGLIITDGMEMNAVTNNFGGYDQTAIKAINAGADLLLYTTNTNPQKAYKAVLQAVNNNEISISRIEESVRRILLKKLKYGILDNSFRDNLLINQDTLNQNEQLNIKFAMESLTLVKGNFDKIQKDEKVLIISPTTSNTLGVELENNSFACYSSVYLKNNGYKNCEYKVINSSLTMDEYYEIAKKIDNYDYIIFANSNVNSNNEYAIKLVKAINAKNIKSLVIALDSPYDLLSYGTNNVKNYIAVYGYQKASVIALSKYLNNEFSSTGVLPLNKTIFE